MDKIKYSFILLVLVSLVFVANHISYRPGIIPSRIERLPSITTKRVPTVSAMWSLGTWRPVANPVVLNRNITV